MTTAATDAGEAFAPILSQPEFDRRLAGRLDRERAKHAKALEELEQSHQAELQQHVESRQAVEKECDAMRAELVRSKVAVRYGLSEDDAQTLLTGSDEATLAAQAERLVQLDGDRRSLGNYVPSEGRSSNPGPSDGGVRQFIHDLFGYPAWM